MAEEKKGRTIVEHAAYELTKAGMVDDPDPMARQVATDTISLVRKFEKQDHTEQSARFVLEAFETLCQFLPLSPITDDPDEWEKFEIERKNIDTGVTEKQVVWKSKRASMIFSEDQGKTYINQQNGKVGTSVDYLKQAEEIKAEKQARADRKAAAEERAKNPNPAPAADLANVPAGEAVAETKPGTSVTAATAPEIKKEAK